MKNEVLITLSDYISKEDVKKHVLKTGSRGLDTEEADKLGVFMRISNMICAMHTLTLVQNRLYTHVSNLLSCLRVRKFDIKQQCAKFEKAMTEWYGFWREYQTVDGVQEMNKQEEDFYRQYMRWACLPLEWNLGDKQETEVETEPLIVVETKDRVYRLYRDVAESEIIEEPEEEWCVMVAERKDDKKKMRCVERGMDKSSAFMCAKRMSDNDKEHLYTASKIEVITEKRTEVIPYKAYIGGEKCGDVKKRIK